MSTFSLVLHAHMPYCRKAGTWPAGEEWLFEAMLETYLPLIRVMRRWQTEALPFRLVLGLVPVLAEQLDDPYMQQQFARYLDDRIQRAQRDLERFAADAQMARVAQYWLDTYSTMRELYQELDGKLCEGLRTLCEAGCCELMCSSATHAFLPLFHSETSIAAQLAVGVESHRKRFGQQPRAFWLPECAYRPATESPHRLRALDELLVEQGLEFFFVESSGLLAAQADGPHPPSTYRPALLPSGMAAFGRNQATGKQVWSPQQGYPGAAEYLEFHRKDPESGLRYHRVSQGDEKQLYVPEQAQQRLRRDAEHFVALLHRELMQAMADGVSSPIIVSPYDAELFGHWWHEGVSWIDELAHLLANDPMIRSQSPSEHLRESPEQATRLRWMPSSTWGENGDFTVWQNPQHAWIWPLLNDASRQVEELAKSLACWANDDRAQRLRRQVARELLLLQGSDWPFLLHTGQASDYANQRFHQHHQRLMKLLWACREPGEQNRLPEHELAALEELDNPWPQLGLEAWTQ